MFLIFLLYALFGVTFTLGKECLAFMPPISFIGFRMIIAGILLLGYSLLTEKREKWLRKEDLLWFAGIVFLHIYAAFVFEFLGLDGMAPAKASLLFNLSPFITAIISYFLFKEIITIKKALGLIIGFIGFLPILLEAPSSLEKFTASSLLGISLPELYVILAVVAASLGWIFLKKLTQDGRYSYFYVNGIGMLGGGIAAAITALFMEVQPPYVALLTNSSFMRSFILLTLISNVICFNLYGKLLKRYTATIIAFFGFFTPLFSAFFDWILLGQKVTFNFYLSVLITTVGLYLYYQEELKQGYIVKN